MALTFDQALMLADDVLGNGQAEPGTVRAAADHWEKDGFLQFCRDAWAVVDDRDLGHGRGAVRLPPVDPEGSR